MAEVETDPQPLEHALHSRANVLAYRNHRAPQPPSKERLMRWLRGFPRPSTPTVPLTAFNLVIAMLAFGCVLQTVTRSNTPPATTTPASNGMFGDAILGIRFFSPKSAVAVTIRGILVTDGSLDSWKGVAGWDKRHDWIDLLGGTDSTLYLRTTDNQQVIIKEGSDLAPGTEHDLELQVIRKNGKSYIARNTAAYTLWRWTADSGLTALRALPKSTADPRRPAVCAFASDLVGAFADAEKLMVTADGGKTWVENQQEFASVRKHHDVMLLQFANDRTLAVGIDSQWLEMLEIDEAGNTHQRWKTKLFGEGDYGDLSLAISDPWRKVIWIHAESRSGRETFMRALTVAEGTVVVQFDPFDLRRVESLGGCSVDKTRLYTWGTIEGGAGAVRIWNITEPHPKLVSQITVQKNLANLDGAYSAPDSSAVWLLVNHWQLIRWNGQSLLTGPPRDWQGPNVDARMLDKTEESWPPGKEPTRREMQANQDQFETHRQMIIWETKRALELKSSAPPAPIH